MLTGGYRDLLCWYQRNLAHEDWLAAGGKHERHRHLVVDGARSLTYRTNDMKMTFQNFHQERC